MSKIFLYGEFQTSVPSFTKELWGRVNEQLRDAKGLVNKTWLYGLKTNTVGGIYEFDSEENARDFATGLYAEQAKHVGASLTVKLFDGEAVREASKAMRSPYF
ncbi:YdhR family protein [Dinghuibacter silviterrae]|uniref:Putative monooxygenase ydhR n=1 Tax=Dinghuibacter silviterrae TaxID=1539049 RepID=A0A4R8DY13_9BACT|nr:YdhR family protein [Dinghuibacter silviterrae]TDX02101.1 putative monooxygenase ydhR [Dinghuibacter silviterrae]